MEKTISSGERLVQIRETFSGRRKTGRFRSPETGNLKYLNAMGVNVYELCDRVRCRVPSKLNLIFDHNTLTTQERGTNER